MFTGSSDLNGYKICQNVNKHAAEDHFFNVVSVFLFLMQHSPAQEVVICTIRNSWHDIINYIPTATYQAALSEAREENMLLWNEGVWLVRDKAIVISEESKFFQLNNYSNIVSNFHTLYLV